MEPHGVRGSHVGWPPLDEAKVWKGRLAPDLVNSQVSQAMEILTWQFGVGPDGVISANWTGDRS